jgi:uncharacterized membrane protein YbhN (UPF0104 family)
MAGVSLRPWLRWTIRFAGLLVFPLLIWLGVDLRASVDILRRADGTLVLLAVGFSVIGVLLRVWRWRLVGIACGLGYAKYLDYLRLYLTGLLAGAALPQVTAMFIPALFVSSEGGSWRRATVSVILDRLLEAVLLVSFAAWAALYLFRPDSSILLGCLAALGAVCAGGGAAFALAYAQRGKLAGSSGLWRLPRLLSSFARFQLWGPTLSALRRHLAALIVASLAILALQVAGAVALAWALDLRVSLVSLVAAYGLVLLATSLPISMLGLGPREGVAVAVLTGLGAASEEALAFGLLLSAVALATRLAGLPPLLWRWRTSRLSARLAREPTLVTAIDALRANPASSETAKTAPASTRGVAASVRPE